MAATCVILHAVTDLNTWLAIDKANDFFVGYKQILQKVEEDLVACYKNCLHSIGLSITSPSADKPPLSEGAFRSRLRIMRITGVTEDETDQVQKTYRAAFIETVQHNGLQEQWNKCVKEMFDSFSQLPGFRGVKNLMSNCRLPSEPPPTNESCEEAISEIKRQVADQTLIGQDWRWLADYLPRNIPRFAVDRLADDHNNVDAFEQIMKNTHASELLRLHDSDNPISSDFVKDEKPSEIFKWWYTKKIFVCFIIGHGTVDPQSHHHLFWHQQKLTTDDCKSHPDGGDVIIQGDGELKSIGASSIQKYWEKWWQLVKAREMRDSHLIIVADVNSSGQLVDDLKNWASVSNEGDNNSISNDLEKMGCSITVQASCASNELAKGRFFTSTWVALNQQLFAKNDFQRPEPRNSIEILSDDQLQHPDCHTVGVLNVNKQVNFFTKQHAQFLHWQWQQHFPKIANNFFLLQPRTITTPNCKRQKIIKTGKYSVEELKCSISPNSRQFKIAAFVKPTRPDIEGWVQYAHVNLDSLCNFASDKPNWTFLEQNPCCCCSKTINSKNLINITLAKDETAIILPPFTSLLDKIGDELKEFGSLESSSGEVDPIYWIRTKDSQVASVLKLLELKDGMAAFCQFPVKKMFFEGKDLTVTASKPGLIDLSKKNGVKFIEKILQLLEKNGESNVLLASNGRQVSLKQYWSNLGQACLAVKDKLAPILQQLNKDEQSAERLAKIAERDAILANVETNWTMLASIPRGLRQTHFPSEQL